MAKTIIAAVLLVISVILSLKHGWDGLHFNAHPEQAEMAAEMGLNKSAVTVMSILSIAVAIALLFPKTFVIANAVNAITILLIMILCLKGGNYKIALIEIPFLIIPLLLIYLGHPLKSNGSVT
jgi:uncharacterized membrane protein